MLSNQIGETINTSLEVDEFVERKTKRIFKEIGAFKRVSIGSQNKWAIEDMRSHGTYQALDRQQQDSTRLTFNVNAFKAHVRPNVSLTRTTRQHLMTARHKRTTTDLKVFISIIDSLKPFSSYPQSVRRGLAKIAYYEACEEDTVIVSPGDTGHSLYFILTGSVSVEVAEDDSNPESSSKQTVAEMFAGDMFGEVSLLHNIERTATIISKERSEFLRIDKPDFDQVLKNSYEDEWESHVNYLRLLPEFQGFSNKELQNAAATSKVVQYPGNTVILRGNKTDSDFVYFIKSGQCRVVTEMTLVTRTLPFGASKLILPPGGEDKKTKTFQMTENDTMRKYFLVVRVMEKGNFFGLGEHTSNMVVVTTGKVEIVQVPRVILARANRGVILTEMREYLLQSMPSPKQIFRSFVEEIKWQAYKRQMILEVLGKRKQMKNTTTFNDVPLTIRSAHPDYVTQYASDKLPLIPLKA